MVAKNKIRVQVTMEKVVKAKIEEVAKHNKASLSETIMTLAMIGLLGMTKDIEQKEKEA